MTDLSPALQKILLKICQRYERRGVLSGLLKLGNSLPEDELRPIENFFGLRPLINTANGELKLSFDRHLAGKSPETVQAWLDEIYQLLGRELPAPALPEKDDRHLLLEQLRLSFPRLDPVHRFLRSRKGALGSKLTSCGDEVREFFFNAGRIVDFLLDNEEAITLSDLGARFCGSSKVLRQGKLKNIVEQWLGLMRPDFPKEAGLWQEFLVVRDRLTVSALVFGPLIYQKGGREYDWINQLYLAGEPALVSWFHLEGVTSFRFAGERHEHEHNHEHNHEHDRMRLNKEKILITCENEAPFSILLREKQERLILFTAGFPNRAVRKIYQFLGPLCSCRHWGDSDLAGLRIAAILNAIFPLNLWRCDLAAIKRHKAQLLPLEKGQAEIAVSVLDLTPDFPFRDELFFTLKHGWLEQESWYSDDSDTM